MGNRRRLAWVTISVGILAVISPFVLTPQSSLVRNDLIITGCIISATGILDLMWRSPSTFPNYLPAVNIIAGIGLFISTSWMAANTPLVWNNVVFGFLTIVTALVALSYGAARY